MQINVTYVYLHLSNFQYFWKKNFHPLENSIFLCKSLLTARATVFLLNSNRNVFLAPGLKKSQAKDCLPLSFPVQIMKLA